MRYFLTLSYRGTHYCGWQVQPNGASVQAELEKAWSTILRQPIAITGCGRTDTGVHARYYVAHFDTEGEMTPGMLHRLNSLLPDDVAVHSFRPMHPEAHARFDATERSYEYHLGLRKNPFDTETVWYFSQYRRLDFEKMQLVADLLPRYRAFSPFCKTHSGVENYACDLRTARWIYQADRQQWVFYISANRFLRGMVRLVVGACLQVGQGKLDLADVEMALEKQQALPKNLSAAPQGLFLVDVKYPYPVADDSSAISIHF
ncbi:MAG: tRNA pseudouridine synthase A [Saprospiraceae bacterium]